MTDWNQVAQEMEAPRQARRYGIDLNAAEASNLPSMRGIYKTAKGLPGEAGDIAHKWEQGVRAPQVAASIDRELGKLSPVHSTHEAGGRLVKLTRRVVDQNSDTAFKQVGVRLSAPWLTTGVFPWVIASIQGW